MENTDGLGMKQNTGETQNSPAASATKQETPAATPTFTPEQVQQQISAALSKAGRASKNLETATAAIAAREAMIQKAEQERELAELEAVKDKPDELTILQRKQKLAQDIRAHNTERQAWLVEKASHEAEINEAKATRFEVSVYTIAEKAGVSPESLKEKASEIGLTDVAAIEKLAALMPKKTPATVPDSGKTAGGGEDLSKLTPRELINRGLNKK